MQTELMKFDPATGEERPYPSHAAQWRNWHGVAAWLFDPWTGKRRNAYDVGSDVHGLLIVPAGTLGGDAGGGASKQNKHDATERESELLREDAEWLDWLEAQINERGEIHLHDGNHPRGLGIGLRPSLVVRTLREGIDAARGTE